MKLERSEAYGDVVRSENGKGGQVTSRLRSWLTRRESDDGKRDEMTRAEGWERERGTERERVDK
jgi:hypothetical protein